MQLTELSISIRVCTVSWAIVFTNINTDKDQHHSTSKGWRVGWCYLWYSTVALNTLKSVGTTNSRMGSTTLLSVFSLDGLGGVLEGASFDGPGT